MKPFRSHRGLVVTLDRANVDTDQIIAKQFLKSIARTGFGPHLFHDWRTRADGSPDPEFALNRPRFKGASILVARNNFGCGSSREHAVWAIQQAGFAAVIAPRREDGGLRVPGFADIFRNNAFKNALPAIELSEQEVEDIFRAVEATPALEATVDLETQRVTLHLTKERPYPFEIDPAVKERLLGGLDDIGLTLKEDAAIAAFEKGHDTQLG